jgi:hypothetical protein
MTDKEKIISHITETSDKSEININNLESENNAKASSNPNKDNVISDILSKRNKNSSSELFAQESPRKIDEDQDRKQNLISLLTGEAQVGIEQISDEANASEKSPPPADSSEQIRRKNLVAALSGTEETKDQENSSDKAPGPPNHLNHINGNTLAVHTFLKKLNVYEDKSYDDVLLLVESIIFEFVEESDRKKFTYEVLKSVANSFKPNSIS